MGQDRMVYHQNFGFWLPLNQMKFGKSGIAIHFRSMFIHILAVFRIRIHGSGPFWLDPDPFLDPDPRIQVIWCVYWIPGKIWGHLDIWILKIRQGVQKLWIFCQWSKFWPKNPYLEQICQCCSYFWRWTWPKIWIFRQKSAQLWCLLNFWTNGRIFKLQKSKLPKISSNCPHLSPWKSIRLFSNCSNF